MMEEGLVRGRLSGKCDRLITLLLVIAFFLLITVIAFGQSEKAVVVYGSNTCDHCIAFKKSLDSARQSYVFYDIDVDRQKEMEMVGKLRKYQIKGNITLPVVEVNAKKLLIGTTWQSFSAYLEEAKE